MLRKFVEALRNASGRGTRGRVRWDGEKKELHAEIEFKIAVVEDEVDGGYVVECVNLPGCMSQGETVEEALDNLSEAIAGVLAARIDRNLHDQEARSPVHTPSELTVPLNLGDPDRGGVPA